MTDVTGALAEGDHSVERESAENTNKIGQKAQAVQVFKYNDIETPRAFPIWKCSRTYKKSNFPKAKNRKAILVYPELL